jgi:hypothetical protein
VHEAPIVVGHPKDNGPAYGWVKALTYSDGMITAEPIQVDAEFSEMVQAGRFKKRSASFYTPDAPNNPKPGTYYLRHVGFLGAQPPAVKGLKDVSFSDAEEGVIELGESDHWAWSSMAAIVRGFREWVIGKDGIEAADKVIPNFYVNDLEAAAKAAREAAITDPAALPAFNEEDPMTIQELQARVAELTAQNATLTANQKPADFAERETGLAAREAAVAAAEAKTARLAVDARLEAAVKAGKVLPARAKSVADFAMGLADSDKSIDFGEGDKAEKITQREAYLRQVESGPKLVDYSEKGAGQEPPADAGDPVAVAALARAKIADAAAKGQAISFTEAVAQVTAEISAE